ncbi:uncharacterized protein LOC108670870 [Hyalella azteca]|uniref:Uncharacterized protein LOC108670870 n=1 Tax=Hyalella azteca TaxID=294128 RepID=A0A8B7NJL4_HYAAZ|nr:uncharacterized protein LOC108670870 [Hyalella azteca]
MLIRKLLAFAVLSAVKETIGTSIKYLSGPAPVETLLGLGVTSRTYSNIGPLMCALMAEVDHFPAETFCVHKTNGECLLLNSTYLALFNRSYSTTDDYDCFKRENDLVPVAPPCQTGFDWVADVGCVVVMETRVTYDVAKASCPSGSQLVSLYYDNFWKLANYVLKNSYQKYGQTGYILYHLGVHRINRVWIWRTGQVMLSSPKTDVWGPVDPNDDSDCAFMQIYSGEMSIYMVDNPCTSLARYVCALQ